MNVLERIFPKFPYIRKDVKTQVSVFLDILKFSTPSYYFAKGKKNNKLGRIVFS